MSRWAAPGILSSDGALLAPIGFEKKIIGLEWRKALKHLSTIALILMLTLGAAAQLGAAEGLIETVAKGCETEITTYCKDVTPGEGRVLACLYAHGDKLSGKCEYALYDAAARLERAVAAMTYLAGECQDDLKADCQDVKAGQGRLLKCLKANEAKLSDRCRGAFQDVGME